MTDRDASLPEASPQPHAKNGRRYPKKPADFLSVARQVSRVQRTLYEAAQKAGQDVSAAKSARAREEPSRRLCQLSEQWIKITETRRIVLGLPHPDKVSPHDRNKLEKHRSERWGTGIDDAGDHEHAKESLSEPDRDRTVTPGDPKTGAALE